MNIMTAEDDFDLQAAWMRKMHGNALANFHAFALRVREALPNIVRLSYAQSGFFKKTSTATSISFIIGDNAYVMRLDDGNIETYVSIIMNKVAIRSDKISMKEWFTKLSNELKMITDNSRNINLAFEKFLES